MLLIDTDMLVLLAASDLLEQVVALLGFEMKDVRRLGAAIHQVRKSKSFRDQYGQEILEAALPRIESITVAEPATDLELLNRLNESIDPGEAQLVAVAAGQRGTLLVSGDKRAIRDLAACGDSGCIQSMKGRIVTLEAVLWMLLRNTDARDLHGFLQVASFHKTLRIVFTEANLATDGGCAAAVRSYFIGADRDSAGLLYNPDPELLSASASG
jgi:hypothetical protein